MSSSDSPFSLAALNKQTQATKALIPAFAKVTRSNERLAASIEQCPVDLQTTLDRLKDQLREITVTAFNGWNQGREAAWKAYSDRQARLKGVQGLVGTTLQKGEDYFSSLLSNGRSATKFRETFAEPVLAELRGVIAHEAIVGVSKYIAGTDWWQSFVAAVEPTPTAPQWSPVEVGTDWSGAVVPAADGMTKVAEGVFNAPEEPSVWVSGAVAAWEAYREKAGTIASSVQTLFDNALSKTQGYLVSVLGGGTMSFRELANSIIADLGRVAMQVASSGIGQLFSTGAQALASSGWGSAILSFFQADGGAWNQGVQLYAKGGAFRQGVVSAPTLFGAAGGRLGVMGEAGPEAIMPLARTSDGSLGIRTLGGGGTSVQIHAPVSVAVGDRAGDGSQLDSQALSSNLQRQMQAAAERAVAASWRPGGVSYRQAQGRG